ncbi:Hepatic leukemia factor [Papilio machaon]|uniref:Hepatic leukemia factor n=1 Tax=Papilio machaon TaxID=76193 RepID=A0A194R3B7_PAPMA|nr:Hepatic leukemia factor [Papilio machaon]
MTRVAPREEPVRPPPPPPRPVPSTMATLPLQLVEFACRESSCVAGGGARCCRAHDGARRRGLAVFTVHVLLVTGKSVNAKDTLEDKKDDNELWEAQAAFLGPNLWDKTLPYDPDLKVQQYVDLDEFLSENGMPGDGLGGGHLGGSAFGPGAGLTLGLQAPVTKRERSPSPSDCMSPDTINPPLSPADSTFSMASSGRDFDPRTRAFSDEELKPQPMIKKSRKQVNDVSALIIPSSMLRTACGVRRHCYIRKFGYVREPSASRMVTENERERDRASTSVM